MSLATDHRQLQHCEVIDRELFESSGDAAALLEQSDGPLHYVSPPVGLVIEASAPSNAAFLIRPLWDHRFDSAPMKPLADPPEAVAPITGEALGPSTHLATGLPNLDRVEHGGKALRLVGLPGADLHCQRQTVAIGHEVQFCAETASRAPESVVRWL